MGHTSCIFIVIYQPFIGFSSSYQWNTIYICEIVISAVKYKLVSRRLFASKTPVMLILKLNISSNILMLFFVGAFTIN